MLAVHFSIYLLSFMNNFCFNSLYACSGAGPEEQNPGGGGAVPGRAGAQAHGRSTYQYSGEFSFLPHSRGRTQIHAIQALAS